MPSATDAQLELYELMWNNDTAPAVLRSESANNWGSPDTLSIIIRDNGKMSYKARTAVGNTIEEQYTALEEEMLAGQDYSNCLFRIGLLREMHGMCLKVAGLAESDLTQSLDEFLMDKLHTASGDPDVRPLLKDDYRFILSLSQHDPHDRSIYSGLSRFCP